MTATQQWAEALWQVSLESNTLPPASHTNTWILGNQQCLVIDPGAKSDECLSLLLETIDTLHLVPTAIVLTHHHLDHCQSAEHLARYWDVPILCHPETASRVGFATRPILQDGETLPGPGSAWQVLHTPGHAPGHLCFYNSHDDALILGDMIAGTGTILIDPAEGNMSDYLRQLERLAAIRARLGLPSHGSALIDPSRAIQATVTHRLARETMIYRALQSVEFPLSLDALLPLVYADLPEATWPLARLSLQAHLDKLIADGTATKDPGGYQRCVPAQTRTVTNLADS